MSEICYKTRGKSSPNYKCNVLLIIHDDDRGKFLDRISNDVLTQFDCVVLYYSELNQLSFNIIEAYSHSAKSEVSPGFVYLFKPLKCKTKENLTLSIVILYIQSAGTLYTSQFSKTLI